MRGIKMPHEVIIFFAEDTVYEKFMRENSGHYGIYTKEISEKILNANIKQCDKHMKFH
jgi:sRNA-binding carbon storage regulator CsrA